MKEPHHKKKSHACLFFKNWLIIFPLLFLFFCPSISFAQIASEALNQQDWITRQQQNIFDEKKRNSEFEIILNERERKQKEESSKNRETAITGETSTCIPIMEIRLLEAKSLSNFRKKRITSPFIGQCADAETLAALIKAVNDYYQSEGFATTQVLVPKQNLQSGIFELKIIEGQIEKIIFEKAVSNKKEPNKQKPAASKLKKRYSLISSSEHFYQKATDNTDSKRLREFADQRLIDKMQKFTAFGNIESETLNLNDLNQGIYQMNRLQSNSAVMKIEPGSETGKSIVKIENNKKFPAKFTIGHDNLGNNFTGIFRSSFSSNFDNLLFLNDNLNLNYSTNLRDSNRVKEIKSFSGSLSIPFKFNSLSYDYSHSEFKGQNAGKNGPLSLTGFSQISKITFDRVLKNSTNLRLSGNAALSSKSSASYLNGDKISTSKRSLSILNLGLTASYYPNNSSSIYLNPSYAKGLKLLNAEKDEPSMSNTKPKAQFELLKFYGNFSKKFTLPKINAPVSFVSELNAQKTKQTVFGSEQMSVGGYYSVRGFRENYINGDSGYYFRNKLSLNLGSLVAPFSKAEDINERGFFEKNLAQLNKISVEPFYDYGYVKNNYVDEGASGRLAGAGAKTIFNSKFFSASLTCSWAANRSQLITSPEKENKMIYFELTAGCC